MHDGGVLAEQLDRAGRVGGVLVGEESGERLLGGVADRLRTLDLHAGDGHGPGPVTPPTGEQLGILVLNARSWTAMTSLIASSSAARSVMGSTVRPLVRSKSRVVLVTWWCVTRAANDACEQDGDRQEDGHDHERVPDAVLLARNPMSGGPERNARVADRGDDADPDSGTAGIVGRGAYPHREAERRPGTPEQHPDERRPGRRAERETSTPTVATIAEARTTSTRPWRSRAAVPNQRPAVIAARNVAKASVPIVSDCS